MVEPLSSTYRRAKQFRRRILFRNVLELGVGGWLVARFGDLTLDGETAFGMRIAAVLAVVGVVVVAINLVRRTWVGPVPPPGLQVPIWYRRQLARQRDALRAVPRWYLAPLAPGLAAFAATAGILRGALMLVVFAVSFVFVAWLNRRAAAALDRELQRASR